MSHSANENQQKYFFISINSQKNAKKGLWKARLFLIWKSLKSGFFTLNAFDEMKNFLESMLFSIRLPGSSVFSKISKKFSNFGFFGTLNLF